MAKFLTSARSVDMLGRQQIAGIPTAVSEIFKNAYDAYATSVRGDFFPDKRVLIIRDNGVGMTDEDFQSRWLTVGTDSKAPDSVLPPIPRPSDIPARRQMGEKGIGRLAIASTGPQLLIATRAERHLGTEDDHLVVALIQWTLFEVPGLTLDDVVIPLRRVDTLDEVDTSLIHAMRDELARGVAALGDRLPAMYADRLAAELAFLRFDPRPFLRLNGPRLDRGAGTAFVVAPVSDDLDAVMEVRDLKPDEFSVSEFQRFLLGFTNTMTSSMERADFATEFIRHDAPAPRDIIDPDSYFWSADDFKTTDHTVDGEFDEFGSFSGTISIYGAEPKEIQERWMTGKGNRSACGPFKIKFGYVQGKASESRLTPDDFVAMTSRLEKIGGLYVYRDGIRVLPYGNADTDYLEIEKRRSLNAATYYFSYRRMFGAIEIDSGRNRQLQEKAGREGFRENRAYRDFRDILQQFLIQLAAHFFSGKADTAEQWRNERRRLDQSSAARTRRRQAEALARRRFAGEVANAITYIESGRLAEDAQTCLRELQERIQAESAFELSPSIRAAEHEASNRLSGIRDAIEIVRPRDLPLSREEEREWQALESLREFAYEVIGRTSHEIERLLNGARAASQDQQAMRDEQEQRGRRVAALYAQRFSDVEAQRDRVVSRASSLGEQIVDEAKRLVEDFDASATAVLDESNRLGFVDEMRVANEIELLTVRYRASLERLEEHARSLAGSEVLREENRLLKEDILDLQEQMEANLELLQLGQAVQIVSHEFEASIRSVRNGLKDLTPWARATPRLQPIVRDLRASFAHLDGYLRLFTPLQRRLYREAVQISGKDIEDFLSGVFSERLRRHEVDLIATDAFRHWALEGFPSTFYPTFVNLVDNAIYWVTSESSGHKVITLDSDGRRAYISDTGPGVRPRDGELIFERGFSRRRGGRGLGLALAKELLERDGWRLDLEPTSSGARFCISPEREGEE